jgi:Tfp pilus assembly PilM family ATPase
VLSWSTSDVAGVNFGDSHITVTRLRGKSGGPFAITHAGWTAYDSGAPEKDIAAALKALWREAGMPTSNVVASLRSAALVIRYFKYPAMARGELDDAVELQAEECLQLQRGDLVVDCHINGPTEAVRDGATGNFIEGVLAAAPVHDVSRIMDIMFMAGLDLLVLDVRAMAVANLYAALAAREETVTTCLVSLSPHSADVIVLAKGGAIYPHTVFCRASTWDETPAFLCENIRDVMKYSEFKLDWEPVQKVVLTGEVQSGDFLAKVQSGLSLPLEHWEPLKHVGFNSRRIKNLLEANAAQAAMLAPSLGLALRRG